MQESQKRDNFYCDTRPASGPCGLRYHFEKPDKSLVHLMMGKSAEGKDVQISKAETLAAIVSRKSIKEVASLPGFPPGAIPNLVSFFAF